MEIGGPDSKSKYEDGTTFYHKKYDKTSPHNRLLYRSESPSRNIHHETTHEDHHDEDIEEHHSSQPQYVEFEIQDCSSDGSIKKLVRTETMTGGACVIDYR